MKLQDIETTTREAIEQLNLVRQELIETIKRTAPKIERSKADNRERKE